MARLTNTASFLAALALLVAAGCSPEGERARGGGPGADIGNTAPPIEMHGTRERNNPNYRIPTWDTVPAEARGVPGWWVRRGQ